ncbi:MAG: hypothetical protein WCK21_10110, partial [Actinomycetota bacterium]
MTVLAALDVARFLFDAPTAIGWPGFFVAWAVPWLIGTAWRRRVSAGSDPTLERRAGWMLAGAAGIAAVALVMWCGYFPALIDAVPGKRSNTSPPTLFTAVAAMAQVGLLMVVAVRLDHWADRLRGLLDRAGEAAVAVYAWHLTALALCTAPLAAGVWTPRRFGLAWWLTRPLWFVLVLGVTAAFVAATGLVRGRGRGSGATPARWRVVLGVVAAVLAAAVVGRWGPRTLPGAIVPAAGFVLSWWCLRGPSL